MTSDELAHLSFNDLVERILQLQITVAQLQARIAELELRTSHELSSVAPPTMATTAVPSRPILMTHDLNAAHVRRSPRRHRSRWKLLQERAFPKTAIARSYVIIAALTVIILAVAVSLALPMLFPRGVIQPR